MRLSTSSALALAAAASAQTFTNCDPTKKSCPNDPGLPASSFSSNFKADGAAAKASWSAAAYSNIEYNNGAVFSIANANQGPTIETDFAIFFGRIDIKMKAAKGQGIVSSIVLQSDDLDEIDWEFVGGDNAQVQSNFYGKGNTTTYDRVIYHPVATPSDLYHTYSIDWSAKRLQFLIDGVLVRTIEYNDPLAVYGKNYPQTPSKLKLGNWCGGCSKQPGTVSWAGGKPNFDESPFVMYVDSVNIQNYNPADAYEWTDRSGSWESIKLIKDGSTSSPNGGTGSGSGSGASSAPTASHSVGNIHISNTPSLTRTGMPYSTNSASISAQNPGATGSHGNNSGSEGSGSGGMGSGHGGSGSSDDCTDDATTTATATGGSGSAPVAGSTFTSIAVVGPTGGAALPTDSYPSPNATVSSPAEPSGPVQQTGNAASTLTVASGSLLGLVFSLLFL